MNDEKTFHAHCPDCGALAGHPHEVECDIQRCSVCRSQRLSCDCFDHDPMWSVWTGIFPVLKDISRSQELVHKGTKYSAKSHCYKNCFNAVMCLNEFARATYTEGFAFNGLLPFEHAWLEIDDLYVDPTLPTQRIVYFPGLRFAGGERLSDALKLKKEGDAAELPIFYRFGFGGHDCESFRSARQAADRLFVLNSDRRSASFG